MPSSRIIVIAVSAVAGLAVWLATRGPNSATGAQLIAGFGTFVGVYVVASILVGFIEGVREAQRRQPPPPPRDPTKPQ